MQPYKATQEVLYQALAGEKLDILKLRSPLAFGVQVKDLDNQAIRLTPESLGRMLPWSAPYFEIKFRVVLPQTLGPGLLSTDSVESRARSKWIVPSFSNSPGESTDAPWAEDCQPATALHRAFRLAAGL
jgi:hypothetical protein